MVKTRENSGGRRTAEYLPPIALDMRSETPLYRQISLWFQRAIAAGHLRPGQRIPSTRALARELRVSRPSVLSAYEVLILDGYLQSFVGAGTRVAQAPPAEPFQATSAFAPRGGSAAVRPRAERKFSKRAASMHGPARVWFEKLPAWRFSAPALEQFPIDVWSRLVNRHLRRSSPEVMGYSDPMGFWPFREALAEYLGAFRAVKCRPEQILVTAGSQQGLQLTALALLDPKDPVWIEEPGYTGARQAFSAAGAQPIPVPVDECGLDFESAARRHKDARAVYVTPSHQFPTGVTLSPARRVALLSWAARRGAWILEDDYDSEFRYGDSPNPSLQGADTDGRVIYVGTLSKVMFPALRLGYLVLPEDLVAIFSTVRNANDTFASMLYQIVMTDFIREGHFARHIRKMRSLYAQRREALVAAIASKLTGVLQVVGDAAGMHLLALLPHGVDDVGIANEASVRGIAVKALSQCCIKPAERTGLILGFGNISPREIDATILGLKSIITVRRS
ncbi:MAG TPA: PLP-dependent aminotransferase family protein [Steroidobacteraceae bacterium]|nr:PLP-dependent aminotransferase family protein [Steroidobacteraceae bacterium]